MQDRQVLMHRLRSLERQTNFLKAWSALITLTLVGFIVTQGLAASEQAQAADGKILKVRQLIVIDDRGVERVKIAAPVPDPIINGKRVKRDAPASGMLIYDSKGNERGGYMTADDDGNAFLTLDSEEMQQVTLIAYPKGGAEFGIQFKSSDTLAMQAREQGPRMKLVRANKVILALP